ncbi:helix-turn-helix transcriptional regulator [Paludisphaera soli]|uniref:helix-turn-helix transcriptional regulator n=1 Tax=Paludisphaera soli TaxID=2712865 RepID=UPI001F0F4D42|nr:winged helix-turn-helix domain-containing protein [Paludisphaera soli]
MGKEKTSPGRASEWTFLSNHAHVLLCIARESEIRLRDVAEKVGITERAVQRIVADLEAGRYLERARSGRRNRYEVHPELPLRHPIESHRDVGTLLALVLSPAPTADETPAPARPGREAEAPPRPRPARPRAPRKRPSEG